MANRIIELVFSAYPDGATYIVEIVEPATGKQQVIEGVQANSEEHAIDRVVAFMERKAKAAMGDSVQVTKGPLTRD